MTGSLTNAEQRRYAEQGLVFPIPVLTPDEAGNYRSACDELERRLGGKPRTIDVRQMHLHFPWAFDLATHPRILDAVESLLGPNLLVWATELFAKHPHDPSISIGWHRDTTYTGFAPHTATTAWVALSNSARHNGCLRAIPGRDRRSMDLDLHLDEAVDVVLDAGAMSLHDGDILHGSNPNRSREKRVGFAIRFVTPAARPRFGRPPVVWARGSGVADQFVITDPPDEANPEQTLAAMKRSAANHLDSMLEMIAEGAR